MNKNELWHKQKMDQIKQDKEFIEKEKLRFKKMKLSDDEIIIAIEPLITFCKQLEEEIKNFE